MAAEAYLSVNTFLVNQGNNAERKTLPADEDELFVIGNDVLFLIRYFLTQNRQNLIQGALSLIFPLFSNHVQLCETV